MNPRYVSPISNISANWGAFFGTPVPARFRTSAVSPGPSFSAYIDELRSMGWATQVAAVGPLANVNFV